MAEGTNIIIIGVFLGFFSLVASMGASNLIEIQGLDQAQEIGLDEQEIFSVFDFASEENLTQRTIVDRNNNEFTGLTPNNTLTGKAVYDVSAIEKIQIAYYEEDASLFGNSISVNNGAGEQLNTGNILTDNATGTTLEIDISNVDSLEIVLEDEDVYLLGFIFPETDKNQGFLDRIFNFIGLFDLSSSKPWINYLIVTPLALYGLYFLIKNGGQYIPLT